jgi:hypothetical protein
MSLCDGRWIASFLAMTGCLQGQRPRDNTAAVSLPLLRHCEAQPLAARSEATWRAVAIHVFVRWPMDRFVPRDDEVIPRAAAAR